MPVIARTSSHGGFTLIELLIAIALVGIVGGTTARLVVGQQRFYASVDERLAMRARLRDGADLVAIAVRNAAVQGTPIALATDSAIELGTVIGAGTMCGASGASIALTPDAPVTGRALTSFATSPDTTDDVLVFDRGTTTTPPRWQHARIASVASRPAAALCAASPLVSIADLASGRTTVLTTAPAIVAPAGAPVRLVRRARFDVYRAGDGQFYLGYRACGSGCASVQPIAGPYGTSAPAVTMRYFDAAGARLATPLDAASLARVTRVDVVFRAASRGVVDLPGRGRGIARDSIVSTIALRNAR